MYIFWFLHQTTTLLLVRLFWHSCISFDSYIKPQRWTPPAVSAPVVYLLIPTSNHNLQKIQDKITAVVYLLIPTSNHNFHLTMIRPFLLYIFWFLHQTTTIQMSIRDMELLYIFWFLHQTTTSVYITEILKRCISFDSYIKPQLHSCYLARS